MPVAKRTPYHQGCTFILPGGSYMEGLPKWMKYRTHGCWCSGWKLTRRGFRIWRHGSWRKPKPGELRWKDPT